MVPFIRVTEIWIPSKDRTSLEFGGGSYGGLDDFQSQSHQTVFAFGEGFQGGPGRRGDRSSSRTFKPPTSSAARRRRWPA